MIITINIYSYLSQIDLNRLGLASQTDNGLIVTIEGALIVCFPFLKEKIVSLLEPVCSKISSNYLTTMI